MIKVTEYGINGVLELWEPFMPALNHHFGTQSIQMSFLQSTQSGHWGSEDYRLPFRSPLHVGASAQRVPEPDPLPGIFFAIPRHDGVF